MERGPPRGEMGCLWLAGPGTLRYRRARHLDTVDRSCVNHQPVRAHVIVLGLILLVLGFVLSVPILWTLGIILLVIGVILAILGSTGRAIGGRRHYF